MKILTNLQCVPCRAGELSINDDDIAELLPQIPDWNLIELDGVKRLERQYNFNNFAQALAFSNQVGELAEMENHHPAILTEWGKVTVTWWTHSLMGLHLNDFILAAKTDKLFLPEN